VKDLDLAGPHIGRADEEFSHALPGHVEVEIAHHRLQRVGQLWPKA
jgi:hypothetical protein